MRDTSCPSRKYCPAVGRSRQPTMCMNVDLPDPDGPVTARNSPRWTSRFTPRSARTSTSPTMYVFTRFLTAMTVLDIVPYSLSSAAEAAASRRSAALRHQRIAGALLASRTARGAQAGDAGHDFHPRLQLRREQLGIGAIGDAEPQVHRFQLVIHEQPGAPARFPKPPRPPRPPPWSSGGTG